MGTILLRSASMPIGRRIAPFFAATMLALGVQQPGWACGGLFCQRIPVDQAGEKILFACDGHTITAHVQIQYKGDAKNFSWIVPVPTPPKLEVGTDALFTELRQVTRPQFQLSIRDEGPCEPPPPMVYKSAPAESGLADKKDKVTIVSQEQVGPYDTVVLQANEPGVLKSWLRKNGYVIPAKLDPLLNPYVAGKYSFVALKLTKDKAAGDIQPIVMTYKATKPGIPIRLTSVAALPDMDVFVWVLGKSRAVPDNYRHTRINEARIDWPSGGSNYKDVVSQAVDEAGGQAFVTDYAGPSDILSKEKFTRAHFKLDELAHTRDPVAFAQAVVAAGFFGERYGALNQDALIAFLKRYIRKPHSLAKLDDKEFYRFIEDHGEALHEAGITVDAPKAVAELEAKMVKPAEKIVTLLNRFHRLSAMYTTMSPQEMTQDPTFVFNAHLMDVAAVRKASGVRRCKRGLAFYDTPIEVTLANGHKFNAPAFGPPWRRRFSPQGLLNLTSLPASEIIEQMNPTGDASIIQDNRGLIASSLADALYPRPAIQTSRSWAAEGTFTAGLVLLGILGFRRRRRGT
jgi:hypothetical protein